MGSARTIGRRVEVRRPVSRPLSEPILHRVFVYGTLKEGFPNHARNAGTRLVGDYRTRERYPLLLVGERYSPWLVLDEGEGYRVSGQVFLVDDEALDALDRLERVTEVDGYRRLRIGVVARSSGDESEAFAYLKPAALLAHAAVREGPLHNYTLENALRYRRRIPA